MNKLNKRLLMRGITAVSASLMSFSFVGSAIAEANVGTIDEVLGTKSQTIITKDDGKLWEDYKSDYKTTKEFADANKSFANKVEENGVVLLKNDNTALPLDTAAKKKVTLVGKAAYANVLGGQMGSGAANNSKQGYAQVSLVDALKNRQFEINEKMADAYKVDTTTDKTTGTTSPAYRKVSNLSGSFGMTSKQNWIDKGWAYDINEVKLSELEGRKAGVTTDFGEYKTSVVVLGRINSEGRDYLPGEEGVKTTGGKNAGAKDPLGLSDDERAMIKMAKDNSDRVVVLLNSNSPMEIPEIVSGELEADAIVWIGTPGAYGMDAVAKVLDGTVNPSGHLPDTYAADISASPAAQNWNIFDYANKEDITRTDGDKTYGADDLRASAYTVYQEGIYVGYKYYETRYFDAINGDSQAASAKGAKEGAASWKYEDEVLYTFGAGMSYTTFEQTLVGDVKVDESAKTVTATVTVENTGTVAGRDAVQLYASVPYTQYDKDHNIEKSAIQLLDYEKTPLIEAGKSATVTVTADLTDLASYDNTATNVIGEKGGYVLEKGDYYFAIGDDAHAAVNNVLKKMGKDVPGNDALTTKWTKGNDDRSSYERSANGTIISNQLDDADLNYYKPNSVTYLSRKAWSDTYPAPVNGLVANEAMIQQLKNRTYKVQDTADKVTTKWGVDKGEEKLTLGAMKTVDFDDMRWQSFVEQIKFEDAFYIVAIGGNTTWTIEEIQNPAAKQADGPNGYSSIGVGDQTDPNGPFAVADDDPIKGYKSNTTPNAPIVAATFDKELQREVGIMYGEDSLWTGGPSIWAGGANLHRAPYEGRTHEYFSEDPILSAYALLGMVSGARTKGCLIGPKHFAFNAIEYNRYGLSEYMTEQTAREGELRCFQKAFESGECLAVMTAFNRIGASYINGHTGLMQNILRGEWGFKGLSTTDMVNGAAYFDPVDTIMGGLTMMANGGGKKDLTKMKKEWSYIDLEVLAKDAEFNAQLQQNMKYQWYAYAHSNLTNGLNASSLVQQNMTWWRATFLGLEIGFSVLTALAAAGYVLFVIKEQKEN